MTKPRPLPKPPAKPLEFRPLPPNVQWHIDQLFWKGFDK